MRVLKARSRRTATRRPPARRKLRRLRRSQKPPRLQHPPQRQSWPPKSRHVSSASKCRATSAFSRSRKWKSSAVARMSRAVARPRSPAPTAARRRTGPSTATRTRSSARRARRTRQTQVRRIPGGKSISARPRTSKRSASGTARVMRAAWMASRSSSSMRTARRSSLQLILRRQK